MVRGQAARVGGHSLYIQSAGLQSGSDVESQDLHMHTLFAYFEGPVHKSHPWNRMRSPGANSLSDSLNSVPTPPPPPPSPVRPRLPPPSPESSSVRHPTLRPTSCSSGCYETGFATWEEAGAGV